MKLKSLAIEREYGTGGLELGKKIAETKGIPFYDENAIISNAVKMGHKLTLLKNYEEKKKESILYNIAMIAEREAELKAEIERMIQELFQELKETVVQLHTKEPAVFVGGAVCGIMSNPDDFVKVFLRAGRTGDKCNYLQKGNKQYSNAEIRNIMAKKDKERSIYFRMLTQREWDETKNYDLVYDVSKVNRNTIYTDICQKMNCNLIVR